MEINNKAKEAYNRGYRITTCGKIINPKGEYINGGRHRQGYITISFRVKGKTTLIYAHRIQAYQKYGDDMFKHGIVVRHLNDVKTDNSYDNILIGTASDNQLDIPIELRREKALKARKTSPVKKKHDWDTIKEYYESTKSVASVMLKFNIKSHSIIHYILRH